MVVLGGELEGSVVAEVPEPPEDILGLESDVVESNADGTCAKVVAKPRALRERADPALQPPAWVPGPDRVAGPLSC